MWIEFGEMQDLVECTVYDSIVELSGWSSAKIIRGMTSIQRVRQGREWIHYMNIVKAQKGDIEQIDH